MVLLLSQDRESSFEPQIVKKRQTIMADSMQDKIVALYEQGTSFRDISQHIEAIYGTEMISYTPKPNHRSCDTWNLQSGKKED